MSGQRPPPSETEFPKDFFKAPTMNKLPGQSALLDDAAERRIGELIEWALTNANGNVRGNAAYAIRQAWTEATEAAALKCEAEQKRLLALPFDGKNINATSMAASLIGYLANDIRGGKL